MARLIDADALKEFVHEHSYVLAGNYSVDYGMFTIGIDQCIDEAPTIDAEPVRHGEWVLEGMYRVCGRCGANALLGVSRSYRLLTNYCPNCGAKMDGGIEK